MGFDRHPFSKFSAEEEIDYLSNIFHSPNYYQTILQDILENNTRLIFGERGIGKSALLYKLLEEIQAKNKDTSLTILIDDYSYLVQSGNNLRKKYLIFLTRALLKDLLNKLLATNKSVNSLDEVKKEKLSFLIQNFSKRISKKEFLKFQESHRIYNDLINPILNNLLSTGVAITSDTISKSLGLNSYPESRFYKEYLPKLGNRIESINLSSIDDDSLVQIFSDLIEICKSLGYCTILFFFDKIDEDEKIASLVNEEVELLLPLLKQNNLLLSLDFGIVFFLWSKVKGELNRNTVRFDKIKPIDITWSKNDLLKIIDKRTNFFSKGSSSFQQLFQNTSDSDFVIEIANGSPRDLLRLLSSIYDEQENNPTNLGLFTSLSVNKGILKFLSEYDFYALYPAQRGTKQDIKNIISKLKQIGKPKDITVKDLIRVLKYSYQGAISNIKVMKNYGVLEENTLKSSTEKFYEIADPKISFIVENKIDLK